jgi:hypothetical protein
MKANKNGGVTGCDTFPLIHRIARAYAYIRPIRGNPSQPVTPVTLAGNLPAAGRFARLDRSSRAGRFTPPAPKIA